MSKNVHRAKTWAWRTVLGVTSFLFVAIAAGVLYQLTSLFHERRSHPMPGRLVDVGGYRMHIDCIGQGSPTVVLDSGLGDSFISWQKVQPKIGQFVRVCSYDRAGMGYSEPSSHARTSLVFAEELHQLLHNAGVPPPYVLVGHSMAAYDIRLYASHFRDDVIGIVFIDGSHPDQLQRFPPALDAMNSKWIRQGFLLEFATPIGISRLLGYCGSDPALRAAECTFNDARENAEERMTFRESAALAKDATIGPDIALIAVSHDPNLRDSELPVDMDEATNAAWERMQIELSQLSAHGSRVIAAGSGHYIQNDRPDVVIQAVHEIVGRVRQESMRQPRRI